MAFTRALYYPHIDITDEAWLKTAALYWENIQTIVPASIRRPYSSRTARELEEAQVLSAFNVDPNMEIMERIAEKAGAYLESPEFERIMRENGINEFALIHPEKLPREIREICEIHPEKLPYEIQYRLRELMGGGERGWMRVHPAFANFYMTLLATELSASSGIGLLTDTPSSERLSTVAKLNAPPSRLPLSEFRSMRRRHSPLGFGQPMPRDTAQAMLAQLTLKQLTISEDTPVGKILDFKRDHKSELGRFRTKLEELTKSVESDLPAEALQQRVADIYVNDVGPAIEDLKKALKGSRMKYAIESFLKTSSLSIPTGSALMYFGHGTPQALLAVAGISLTASTVLYGLDRRKELRGDPFSFVLAVERRFGTTGSA
jgi:hypothetical protein